MKKRVFSMLLALVMALSLLPTMAVAEGETISFQLNYSNDAIGTVSYRFGNDGDFTVVEVGQDGSATIPVTSGVETVTIIAIPGERFAVNQSRSGIWINGSKSEIGFLYNELATGFTYPVANNPQFVLEFDNNDGTGGGPGGNPGGNPGGDNGGNNGGDNGGNNGGNPGQSNPQSTIWTALENEIKNYTFAYGPAGDSSLDPDSDDEKNMLKAGIAAELYARKMGNGPDSSDTTLGMALGYNPEGANRETMTDNESAIARMIHFTGNRHNAGDAGDPVNLPYYTFELKVPGNEETPDITEGFTIQNLRVYVLKSDKEFLLKTTKNKVEKYEVVNYVGTKPESNGNEEKDRFVYAQFDVDGRMEPAIEAYGNGIFLNNAISEDGSVFGFHAACEHCGSIGKINCRLIVSSAKNSIQISSTDDAAAWNFINVGVYAAEGTKEEPVNATIFFGSDAITFSTATGGKTVTNVKAVDLPDGAVTFEGGTLTFNTNYDEIKVKVTYNDNTIGYMLLHRVGLNIDSIQIDKMADVTAENNNRFSPTDKAQCTADTFNVWHGSDQSVRYVSSEDQVIVGSFYYDCNYYVEQDNQDGWHVYNGNGSVADNIVAGNSTGFDSKQAAVNALHTAVGSVQLLVTITDNNNNVTRKLVSDPLSGAKAVNNGGFNADVHNAVGYAGQGSNHVYDDFLLWSGSKAEYANIKSVSAIVYNPGTADTFGGVQVGSGTGVQWTNSAE